MMATAAQVEEHRAANRALVTLAQKDLTDFWESLNFKDPFRVRDILLQFFPDVVLPYGQTAAVLAADWYDLLRDVPASAATFRAGTAAAVPAAQAQGSVRWAVGPLFDGSPDATISRLLGATQRLVMKPGRDTIFRSAALDPVRTWVARVPSGAETCAFCVMLAARGAVYTDEVAGGAMNEFHDDCDCVPTAIRSQADWPDGYDPQRYRDLWEAGSGEGRDLPQN